MKNKMMRLASVLLILCIATTCAISGTFAKYTSAASAADTARVAKWGIDAPASMTLDLFDAAYNGSGDTSVASAGTDNVIAPGTTKTATVSLFSVTGAAPEVAYKYEVKLESSGDGAAASNTIAKLDALTGFNWTLKKPGDSSATTYATFATLKAAVDGMTANYAPNTMPTGYATGANTLEIGWAWDFDNATTAGANDAADTAVGNGADLKAFTLTLTIGASQLDTYTPST